MTQDRASLNAEVSRVLKRSFPFVSSALRLELETFDDRIALIAAKWPSAWSMIALVTGMLVIGEGIAVGNYFLFRAPPANPHRGSQFFWAITGTCLGIIAILVFITCASQRGSRSQGPLITLHANGDLEVRKNQWRGSTDRVLSILVCYGWKGSGARTRVSGLVLHTRTDDGTDLVPICLDASLPGSKRKIAERLARRMNKPVEEVWMPG